MKISQIEMHNEYVLVQPIIKEKSDGGIFMPITQLERMRKGKILAAANDELANRVGDFIMYDGYGSNGELMKIKDGDEEIRAEIIKDNQIILSEKED